MSTIPSDYHDLLTAPNTAVLTTLRADGGPNGSPVWFWFDGDEVVVSTRAERAKHRNVLRDPRVSLTVVDPERPLRYIEIRADAEIEPDPDGAMRDRIAAKHGYDDGGAFDPPGATRVNLRLVPTRVIEH
ncbi:MAG: PPOX class F420-dependent oxidoreductase, partial [Actinomycetota bacterium]